jgi:transcriptional regulator with XRE-family HTH domain
MDGVRLGTVCRALRIKKHWRQVDVAARAGVSRTIVSAIETGHVDRVGVDDVLSVVTALGGRLDFIVRWQGGELDRLINARHGALHESVARSFRSLKEWEIAPEVSFNVRGERGVIDILAWHAATRTLLVIELKTEIVDVSELMGTLDKKRRLAPYIALSRGWQPLRIAVWLVVARSDMNRRRVTDHAAALRAALPSDGRSIGPWLHRPDGEIRCLSFWANAGISGTTPDLATVKRVRKRPVKPIRA